MLQTLRRCIITLVLVVSASGVVFAAERQDVSNGSANGTLVGQFMENDTTPLAHGKLFIYDKAMGPPSTDRHVRVPDLIVDLDQNGGFTQVLPAGTYYFTARKKADIVSNGPPGEGQLIYFRMDAAHNIQPFTVRAGQITNAGVVSSSLPRRRNQGTHEQGSTLIEGIVIDDDGAPVEGAVVFVYNTQYLL